MLRGDWQAGACVFAALYTPGVGFARAVPGRWPRVSDALCRHLPEGLSGAARALHRDGLWEEACLLDVPGRLAWGENLVESGRVMTPFDSGYPQGWLDALGSGAPPALWVDGQVPTRPLVGLAGSRHLPPGASGLARSIGAYLASSGRGVVSGGAWGADRQGVAGAISLGGGFAVELLPYGLAAGNPGSIARLSAFAPDAPFSAQRAMFRNRLIHAWSRRSVIVHARYLVGGSWGGAIDALRRGLGRVLIADWGDEASAALCALGAVALPVGPGWRDSLEFALRQPDLAAQPDLFGFGAVRETAASYLTA